MPEFTFDDSPEGEAAAQIAEAMPEPQQHAIDQHTTNEAQVAATVERDSAGVAFDASIHTGTLLRSGARKGQWRLKRSAMTGGASVIGSPRRSGAQAEVDPAAQTAEQARAAARVAASSMFMLGMAVGGQEWQPHGPDSGPDEPLNERKMMEDAFTDYFLAKGVTTLPPGMSLSIAIGAYMMPRFFMPQTKARVGRAKTWFALRLAKWKLQRILRARGINASVTVKDGELFINGARADTWNDGKRQDDAGAKSGGAVQAK